MNDDIRVTPWVKCSDPKALDLREFGITAYRFIVKKELSSGVVLRIHQFENRDGTRTIGDHHWKRTSTREWPAGARPIGEELNLPNTLSD